MKTVSRPSWPWIVVLAATLVVAPWLAWHLGQADPLEREARSLERALRCPVCEGQSVADSNSAVALQMRQEIRRMLAEGRSRDEILRAFADRYGAWVVYMPPRHGWYLLGWAGPFLAVGAGAGLLVWWWRGRRPDPGAVPAGPTPAETTPAGPTPPGATAVARDEPAAPPARSTAATLDAGRSNRTAAEGGATSPGRRAPAAPLDDEVRRWM
ncbi:MAG TPA: cytochrome c-type biogenesis protein CcmH [Thermaerobacter sp.]